MQFCIFKSIGLGIIIVCMIGVMTGCETLVRKEIEWNPAKPNQPALVHTVRWPGETLSIIAKWYTGDGKNWEILVKINPKINPLKVAADNKIVIPGNLLKTRIPLPEKYVAQFFIKSKKKKKSKSIRSKPARSLPAKDEENEEDEEFELFGPKDVISQ